jgi:hypothetical protein
LNALGARHWGPRRMRGFGLHLKIESMELFGVSGPIKK